MRREDLRSDHCGIAQALGVVGDWWTVLVLRDVAGGLTRFDGLQQSLGVSRRALSERLAGLVEDGVLRREPYSDRPPRFDYVLTEKGEGLLPVLLALQEFGDRFLLGDGALTATARADSAEADRVLSLVGRALPEVKLTDHTGEVQEVRPAEGWRVVYCFPGAFADAHLYPPGWGEVPGTAGCTLESRTYAAAHADFLAAGADVVGVSSQRADQQAAFAAQARLPFRLLADPDLRLAAAARLPVFRAAGGERYKRQTLLLDEDGVVRHVQMPITDPAGSVAEMLEVVRGLTSWRPG